MNAAENDKLGPSGPKRKILINGFEVVIALAHILAVI